MDSTLAGAIIGALIAIITTHFTAKQAYKNSSKLESEKMIRAKKEELFITCELVKKSLASNELTIFNVVISCEAPVFKDKFDPSKAHPFHVMRMIINMYLPEFKIDLQVLLKAQEKFHEYYNKYATPHIFLDFSEDDKKVFLSSSTKFSKEIYSRIDIIQQKLSM